MSNNLAFFCQLIFCLQLCAYGALQCEVLLINAVTEGRLDIVEWLINQSGDINAKDIHGATALMHAATSPHSYLVSYLLDNGADPLMKDDVGKTALHLSAESGFLNSTQILYDVSKPYDNDVKGRTALHLAVMRNQQVIADFLLNKGMDPYTKDFNGLTIVHLAAISGQLELLQNFKIRGIDLDVASANGTTPLILAALFDNSQVVTYLIENSANVSAKDANLWSPLHAAAYSGNLDLVKLLARQNIEIDEKNSDGKTPLFLSVEKGHVQVMKYFLEMGLDISTVDTAGNTLLHAASEAGSVVIMNILIKKINVNVVNEENWTPLISAAVANQTEAVKLLLHAGADVNYVSSSGQSVLGFAASTGNLDLLNLLSANSKDVNFMVTNSKNQTLLHFAIDSGSATVVKTVIQLMTDQTNRIKRDVKFQNWKIYKTVTNLVDNEGKTALYYAAEKGHADVLQEILRFGGDYSVAAKNGETPFHVASKNKHLDCLGVLIIQNYDVMDIKNSEGETALFQSVKDGNIKTMEFLINSGADQHITDQNNRTLMHVAAEKGNSDVVKYLMRNKFKLELINARDNKGRSALWYAVHNNHPNITNLLVRELGAEILPKIDILTVVRNGQLGEFKNWLNDNHICQISDYIANIGLGKTLVHFAVESDESMSVLSELFKYSCFIDRINNINSFGKTAAWYAATLGKIDTLKLLNKLGGAIKPNLTLADAVESNTISLVEYFLERGADVNTRHSSGPTVLFRAAVLGYYDVAKLLIKAGADLEALYFEENTTPLHIAAYRKNCDIVQLLIDSGANINPINKFSRTPLDLSQDEVCSNILKKYGAFNNNP